MATARTLDALLNNYRDFDIGKLRGNFDQDKSDQRVKGPVERYSYALMRAALNVFVNQNFAEMLNSLAFDCDTISDEVKTFAPKIWPYYLNDASRALPTASLHQLSELEFEDCEPASIIRFGAWHRIAFQEFELDVLLLISNVKSRSGAFQGLCFLGNDGNRAYALPQDHEKTCTHLGSAHLQLIAEDILQALGISSESAIATIKWEI